MFFLDLQTLRSGDEGWLVLDVTAASDRWLLSRNKDLGLRLYVETDDGKTGLSIEPSPGGSSKEASCWQQTQLEPPHLAPEGWPFSVEVTQWVEGEGSSVRDNSRVGCLPFQASVSSLVK